MKQPRDCSARGIRVCISHEDDEKRTCEIGRVARGAVACAVIWHPSVDCGDTFADGADQEQEPEDEGNGTRLPRDSKCPHREDDLAYNDLEDWQRKRNQMSTHEQSTNVTWQRTLAYRGDEVVTITSRLAKRRKVSDVGDDENENTRVTECTAGIRQSVIANDDSDAPYEHKEHTGQTRPLPPRLCRVEPILGW